MNELTRKVKLKVLCQNPTPVPRQQRRAKSWPELSDSRVQSQSQPLHNRIREAQRAGTFRPLKTASAETEDTATQTQQLLPYEHFLYDLESHKNSAAQSLPLLDASSSSSRVTPATGALGSATTPSNLEAVASRLSPSAMLERYIHVCAHSDAKPSELDFLPFAFLSEHFLTLFFTFYCFRVENELAEW